MTAASLSKEGKSWKLETQKFTLYGSTKADAVYHALKVDNEIDRVFENYSTHTPQSYLNKSKKYGYRTYWGARV